MRSASRRPCRAYAIPHHSPSLLSALRPLELLGMPAQPCVTARENVVGEHHHPPRMASVRGASMARTAVSIPPCIHHTRRLSGSSCGPPSPALGADRAADAMDGDPDTCFGTGCPTTRLKPLVALTTARIPAPDSGAWPLPSAPCFAGRVGPGRTSAWAPAQITPGDEQRRLPLRSMATKVDVLSRRLYEGWESSQPTDNRILSFDSARPHCRPRSGQVFPRPVILAGSSAYPVTSDGPS